MSEHSAWWNGSKFLWSAPSVGNKSVATWCISPLRRRRVAGADARKIEECAMREFFNSLLATMLSLAIFIATGAPARADAVFKVGVTTRDFMPVEPYDWRGAKTHALRAMIWYPSTPEARE